MRRVQQELYNTVTSFTATGLSALMTSTYRSSAAFSSLNGAGAPPPMATLYQTLFRGICLITIAVSRIELLILITNN